MIRCKTFSFALIAAGLGLLIAPPAVHAQTAPLKIGMVKAFFNDVPSVLVSIAVEPFPAMMKQTTGLSGKLFHTDDAFEVARKLDVKDVDIGVFHGHEFAWMQAKYPKLRPLMLTVNQYHDVSAYVVVNKNTAGDSFNVLRGKTFDMPMGTKEYSRVLVEKNCTDNNTPQDPKAFFKEITRSKSALAALDAVAQGKLDAVVVDTLAFEFYKETKGKAYFDRFLRVLKGDTFPTPVLAYKEGSIDPTTLKKFRDGLANAHKDSDGADMMKMWQIDRFTDIPANYAESLARSLKTYPMPTVSKVSLR